jgi:hypothetical protein
MKAPVVRRSVAAALLKVPPAMLDVLPLRRWKEGRVVLYDPMQVAGLMRLRKYWLRSAAL